MKLKVSQSGSTLVEFAIVGFTTLLAIFAMIDGALLLTEYNQVQAAGRLAVRAASVCPDGADVTYAAQGIKPDSITTLTGKHVFGEYPIDDVATVTIPEYTYQFVMLPGLSKTFPETVFRARLESGGIGSNDEAYECKS